MTRPALIGAMIGALTSGCSFTVGGQLSRIVHDASNPSGERTWPAERHRNGGPVIGGRVHYAKIRPLAAGIEQSILNEATYPCCQWRINGLAGVSWLPLERSWVGAEIWMVTSIGSIPVDDDKPFAVGVGPRLGVPIRVWKIGWPCADDPVAAGVALIEPEVGASMFIPTQNDIHSPQVEGSVMLTLRAHVWTDLIGGD